ncbi:hypothetical protein EDD18DRAFT_1106909 [Armillaria luteobubalina]|uniref:Uncharacterized protein n=1 Tax=Armillaria luteobubalina TaxID=153913 RepID=A0AA39UN47_9AGAR|nr:hypothetical protein EDD18DRAFT_1106909 [Armillaria luteobubalina]
MAFARVKFNPDWWNNNIRIVQNSTELDSRLRKTNNLVINHWFLNLASVFKNPAGKGPLDSGQRLLLRENNGWKGEICSELAGSDRLAVANRCLVPSGTMATDSHIVDIFQPLFQELHKEF